MCSYSIRQICIIRTIYIILLDRYVLFSINSLINSVNKL